MRSERAVKIDKPCRSKTLSCFWLDLESESEVTESKCLGRNRDHTFDNESRKAESLANKNQIAQEKLLQRVVTISASDFFSNGGDKH